MRGKASRKRQHLCGKQRFKKCTAVGGRVKRLVRQFGFIKLAGRGGIEPPALTPVFKGYYFENLPPPAVLGYVTRPAPEALSPPLRTSLR